MRENKNYMVHGLIPILNSSDYQATEISDNNCNIDIPGLNIKYSLFKVMTPTGVYFDVPFPTFELALEQCQRLRRVTAVGRMFA